MKHQILAMALVGMALACNANAQSEAALVGTWKLVSASNVAENGQKKESPYGANPTGFLTYTPDRRMIAIISDDGRKPLSLTADTIWRNAPINERAAAYASFIAYAGRYTLANGKVTHHVEAASIPNWVNTDQVRVVVNRDKDHLTLRTTTPFVWDGVRYAYQELAWERVK